MISQLPVKKLVQVFTLVMGVCLVSLSVGAGAFFLLSVSSLSWDSIPNDVLPITDHDHAEGAAYFNFQLETISERAIHPETSSSNAPLKIHRTSGTKSKELQFSSIDHTVSHNNCHMHSCFDIYRCPFTGQNKLAIYVYPFEKFTVTGKPINLPLSKEFYELIAAIVNSPYYESDPAKACIFVPTLDFLNLQRTFSVASVIEVGQILQSLEFWGKDGQNHLLFTLSPDNAALFNISQAAIVTASIFPEAIRQLGFKIPWLFTNPLVKSDKQILTQPSPSSLDKFKLISLRPRKLFPKSVHSSNLKSTLFLDYCSHDSLNYNIRCALSHGRPNGNNVQEFDYPEVLSKFDFCLVNQLLYPSLWDIMSIGCIPVIINEQSTLNLPFDEIIDWKKNAILINENQFGELFKTLSKVSPERKRQLKSQIQYTFHHHFKSIKEIVSTVLNILEHRVFSYTQRPKPAWKSLDESPANNRRPSELPILNPMIVNNKRVGFTTVILAYERIHSLFQVIERLRNVPSLSKVVVIWNNQVKAPPPAYQWPNISKPIQVIQTRQNFLSNRFFPYDEIQTEAIFSLDDDIIMLTPDEIEFGFQTWTEFSDRIVGFPSRTTVWDNSTQKWRYESEWTNQVSMVLTGAAFYHKYWHHVYTYEMPREIFAWVDSKKNCEDIAMNFLIAHHTRKSPLKVSPRKKFKCPNCVNNEMLSADSSHMIARTDCINKFTQIYGYMPMIPVEFRVDPVLFKVDGLPKKMKAFNDVGSL